MIENFVFFLVRRSAAVTFPKTFHVVPFVHLARDRGTSHPAQIVFGRRISGTSGEITCMIQRERMRNASHYGSGVTLLVD